MTYLTKAFKDGKQVYEGKQIINDFDTFDLIGLHSVNTPQDLVNEWNRRAELPNRANLKWEYILLSN